MNRIRIVQYGKSPEELEGYNRHDIADQLGIPLDRIADFWIKRVCPVNKIGCFVLEAAVKEI